MPQTRKTPALPGLLLFLFSGCSVIVPALLDEPADVNIDTEEDIGGPDAQDAQDGRDVEIEFPGGFLGMPCSQRFECATLLEVLHHCIPDPLGWPAGYCSFDCLVDEAECSSIGGVCRETSFYWPHFPPSCLVECSTDRDCRPYYLCKTFCPEYGTYCDGRRVCAPAVTGSPCISPEECTWGGAPEDLMCIRDRFGTHTGLFKFMDGYCSASCAGPEDDRCGPPDYAACVPITIAAATINLCLVRCDPEFFIEDLPICRNGYWCHNELTYTLAGDTRFYPLGAYYCVPAPVETPPG